MSRVVTLLIAQLHRRWVPPVALIVATTLVFGRLALNLTHGFIGDLCAIDFQGTIQQLWLLSFHGLDLEALSSTTYLTYPTPVNLLAELGFLFDVGLIAAVQWVFGFVAGYNIGVWVIYCGLALATYLCARRFGLEPWAATFAGLVIATAQPVLIEVAFGRHYQVLSLATVALALAEWPLILAGRKSAAIRLGVWCTVTLLAHAFTGMVLGIVIVIAAGVALWRHCDGDCRGLVLRLLLAAGVALATALPPVLLQMNNLPSGEEGIGLFTGYSAYYLRVLQVSELQGMAPWTLVLYGRLRLLMLGLAILGILAFWRRPLGPLFLVVLLVAIAVVWGPYATINLANPGGTPEVYEVPLPYLFFRTLVPYFWRLLWINRVVLFANLAVAILAASALAFVATNTRKWPWLTPVLAVVVLAIGMVRPYESGKLPLPESPVVSKVPDKGHEAATMLRRMGADPRIDVVYSYPRALHLQRHYQKPLAVVKWAFETMCGDRSLEQTAKHFSSFVDLPASQSPAEEIGAGLCHVQAKGATHLLYVPRHLLRTTSFYVPSEDDLAESVQEQILLKTFDALATPVDRGGGLVLYQLDPCETAPPARASRPTVQRPPEPSAPMPQRR